MFSFYFKSNLQCKNKNFIIQTYNTKYFKSIFALVNRLIVIQLNIVK